MAAPGVIIEQLEAQLAGRSPRATDGWFVAAPSQRGPLAPLELVPGMEDKLGGYIPDGKAREAVEAFFDAGGQYVVFSRVVGPAARGAEVAVTGPASAASMTVKLLEPGDWGNSCKLQIVNGSGSTRKYIVTDADGDVLETSGEFATVAGAVAWAAANSTLTAVTAAPGTPPLPSVVSNVLFTLGAADHASINATTRTAALQRMTADYGPGQETLLGVTDGPSHLLVLNHALETNRVAICDLPDDPTSIVLTPIGTAHRDLAVRNAARRGGGFASWAVFPAASPVDAPRTLPPSVAVAAQCAINDLAGVPISQPPAGAFGSLPTALALTQPAYTDDQRAAFNDASVNLVRSVFGDLRLYGFRSFTDPDADPAWAMLSAARTEMLVNAIIKELGEAVEFGVIDGQGIAAGTFGAHLTNELSTLWKQGVFYGATQAEAFTVDTGVVVNTAGSIRRRLLQAKVTFTISGVAEVVRVTTTNIPIGG
jgi:hypothetical protein